MNNTVELVVTGTVATIEMRDVRTRNAFTPQWLRDFSSTLQTVATNTSIDAVILTGSAGVFSSGGNLQDMKEGFSSDDDGRAYVARVQNVIRPIFDLEVPVITAVDGMAFGGGFSLALVGDFILASDRAQFCSGFDRVGLIPDIGALYTLPRQIGLQRAKDIVFSGRTFGADEAKKMGLVYDVYKPAELVDSAMQLANTMAGRSRLASGLTKQGFNRSFEISLDQMLEFEARAQGQCLNSEYNRNAVERFFSRSKTGRN